MGLATCACKDHNQQAEVRIFVDQTACVQNTSLTFDTSQHKTLILTLAVRMIYLFEAIEAAVEHLHG